MLRKHLLPAVLSLPVAIALALLASPIAAFADQAGIDNLNARLKTYAAQEGKTDAQKAAYNTATASADDLVSAVYDAVQQSDLSKDEIIRITQSALEATFGNGALPATQAQANASVVRADRNTVVSRLAEAAIIASGTQTDPEVAKGLIASLGSVNNFAANGTDLPAAKEMTLAGRQALVAKVIRATNGQLGAAIAEASEQFYPVTKPTPNANPVTNANNIKMATTATDNARTAFVIGVLKQLAFKPQTTDPAAASTGTYFPVRGTETGIGGNPVEPVGEKFFIEGTPPSLFGALDYVDSALDHYSQNFDGSPYLDGAGQPTTTHQAAAQAIAKGVASTVPAAAGAAIGAFIREQITSSTWTDADVITYLKGVPAAGSQPAVAGVVQDGTLSNAVSDIVAVAFKQLTAGSHAAQAVDLATTQTAAVKGKIASGAIRANPADAADVVNGILTISAAIDGPGKSITQSGLAAFAGAASQGVGNNAQAAADISKAVIDKVSFVEPLHATNATPTAAQLTAALTADNAKIQAVAIAVIKSVAPVNPEAANLVAQSLFDVTRGTQSYDANPYTQTGEGAVVGSAAAGANEQARLNLAKALAAGAATNYTAAAAAVQGVLTRSLTLNAPGSAGTKDATAEARAVSISSAAISAAPLASLAIAQEVSKNLTYTGGSSTSTFASNLAVKSVANAGKIAAGVSLSDTTNTGFITAAVVNANDTLRPQALTIANTVAVNVDVEAIGLIAQQVGALLQPSRVAGPNSTTIVNPSKLPKMDMSIGLLATSLAKAINTKPLVLWANRVDELGELAAELTNVYMAQPGNGQPNPNASTNVEKANLTAYMNNLAAIGSNIMHAVSAARLANNLNAAADISDVAEDVAGAIAQSIASSTLPLALKQQLLGNAPTPNFPNAGKLLAALKAAAGVSLSAQVALAFSNVNSTFDGNTNQYGIYINANGKNETNSLGSTGAYETGAKYEVGTTTDSETPIKNI